eukprot:scaffold18157_cov22-Tisochrysis_lutea.AAC.3
MIEVEEASNYSFGDTVPWGSLSGASPSLMRILRGVEASLGQPSIPEYMVKSHQWVTIARLGAAASTYQGAGEFYIRLSEAPNRYLTQTLPTYGHISSYLSAWLQLKGKVPDLLWHEPNYAPPHLPPR